METVSGGARGEKTKENKGFLPLDLPQQGCSSVFCVFCIDSRFGKLLDAKKQGKPMFFQHFPSQDEGEVEMKAVSGGA